MESVGTPLLWLGFTVFIVVMLVIDLGFFQKDDEKNVSWKESLAWFCVWVALAFLFNGFIYYYFGSTKALEFLTGFIVEKALSVDNIFVFIVVFSYFKVPLPYQHRVIFWGVLGAMIMRGLFVGLGAILIYKFHWITWVFGGFLVFTGIKTLSGGEEEVNPDDNVILKIFRKYVPMTESFEGSKFWVKKNGKWFATPLFLILIVIETTDVIFAVDSVPAVFAVTKDPFIVYTSNIFAILGLRSLFFLLADAMTKMTYLKYGLGLVLIFVGIKMIIVEFYKIPIAVSLCIIGLILGGSILISLFFPPKTLKA